MRTYHSTKLALGGDVTLLVVSSVAKPKVQTLLDELWRKVFTFERQFSRFLPDSELSAFNRSAGLRVAVTKDFHDLLAAAQLQVTKTAGLYNPFILPALQRAGYVYSFVEGYKDDQTDNHADKTVVAGDRLHVEDGWAEIPYGTAIDIGGIGKGYLADLLADTVPEWVSGYWFSLGGDIAAAGCDEDGNPWKISIQDATNKSKALAWEVQGGSGRFAIASSGTINRQGTYKGKAWHHIIDPKTGRSAQTDVLLATVVSERAEDADVLASCAVILGSSGALDYLKKHQATAAFIQYRTEEDIRNIQFGDVLQLRSNNKLDRQVINA